MPRQARKCPPGLPVHVIQRGNNRQVCFASDADLKAYANWLSEASLKFGVSIHAWVFMTNHVHLLMTPSCWAAMVDVPADYLWSSYRAHAFGVNVRMWTPHHDEYRAMGSTEYLRLVAYRDLFEGDLDQDVLGEIRSAANTGLVLGNERFRTQVEHLTGQRQRHMKRGPKPKRKRRQ